MNGNNSLDGKFRNSSTMASHEIHFFRHFVAALLDRASGHWNFFSVFTINYLDNFNQIELKIQTSKIAIYLLVQSAIGSELYS